MDVSYLSRLFLAFALGFKTKTSWFSTYFNDPYNNNTPRVIPQAGSGEDSMYEDLTPTFVG